jgi:hypothetical protein
MTDSAKLAAISRRMERVATASIYNTEAGSRKALQLLRQQLFTSPFF